MQERLLELHMRRQRLISELRIDLAHGLVRLVVRGEHGPQTLCSRAQERLDFDRDRQTAAAVIAPDPIVSPSYAITDASAII